jgi:hypothetical protein
VALENMVSVSFGALVTIGFDVAPSSSYERLMDIDIDIDMYMSETTPSSRMALNTVQKSKKTLRSCSEDRRHLTPIPDQDGLHFHVEVFF